MVLVKETAGKMQKILGGDGDEPFAALGFEVPSLSLKSKKDDKKNKKDDKKKNAKNKKDDNKKNKKDDKKKNKKDDKKKNKKTTSSSESESEEDSESSNPGNKPKKTPEQEAREKANKYVTSLTKGTTVLMGHITAMSGKSDATSLRNATKEISFHLNN